PCSRRWAGAGCGSAGPRCGGPLLRLFFFSSRRRHTRFSRDWSSDVCSSDLSYGYGLSVTPLQIARAYAALGNGGRLVTPTFIKGGHSGESREILAPDIAAQVMRMMQTVTEPGGTATRAAILGYHVAGKTGTARKSSGGGYSRRYI